VSKCFQQEVLKKTPLDASGEVGLEADADKTKIYLYITTRIQKKS